MWTTHAFIYALLWACSSSSFVSCMHACCSSTFAYSFVKSSSYSFVDHLFVVVAIMRYWYVILFVMYLYILVVVYRWIMQLSRSVFLRVVSALVTYEVLFCSTIITIIVCDWLQYNSCTSWLLIHYCSFQMYTHPSFVFVSSTHFILHKLNL